LYAWGKGEVFRECLGRVDISGYVILSFSMTPRRHSLCKKQLRRKYVILNEVKDLVSCRNETPFGPAQGGLRLRLRVTCL
jgi:hypothetical protein